MQKNIPKIPYNKPFLTGKETEYIQQAVATGHLSGDGMFTNKCHNWFEQKYEFKKCLLTHSCTAALEMTALLLNLKKGDEVIVPSYSFVSTANAFALRGAKIVFADSENDNPNIDVDTLEPLINENTKAIVVIHYAGFGCDMEALSEIINKHNLYLIEDCAHSIDAYYNNKPLGSFGQFATFSFHETKNVIAGEGGMLVINDEKFNLQAEIIREKGTNRSAFFRDEVDKYGWVSLGSSYLPSEIIAAFLFAQLENIDRIQKRRIEIWQRYETELADCAKNNDVHLPAYSTNSSINGHLFYLVCNSLEQRTRLISYLKEKEIMAVFHYLSLHKSSYFKAKHDGRTLKNSDRFTDCLVRLPLFYELSFEEQSKVIESVISFFNQ